MMWSGVGPEEGAQSSRSPNSRGERLAPISCHPGEGKGGGVGRRAGVAFSVGSALWQHSMPFSIFHLTTTTATLIISKLVNYMLLMITRNSHKTFLLKWSFMLSNTNTLFDSYPLLQWLWRCISVSFEIKTRKGGIKTVWFYLECISISRKKKSP